MTILPILYLFLSTPNFLDIFSFVSLLIYQLAILS